YGPASTRERSSTRRESKLLAAREPEPERRRRRGEVRGVQAQVAQQTRRGEGDDHEQAEEDAGLSRRVVSRPLRQEHKPRNDDEEHRDHPVETPRLRVRPRIERPHHLTPVVRVDAAGLCRARVADVRAGAVAHEATLTVERVRPELLSFGTHPVVLVRDVREPGGAEAESPPMCVRGEPLEREGTRDEEDRVPGGDDDLGTHVSLAAAASASVAEATPSGSCTSVKRLSGSSSVTCFTVWRGPREGM